MAVVFYIVEHTPTGVTEVATYLDDFEAHIEATVRNVQADPGVTYRVDPQDIVGPVVLTFPVGVSA